MTDKDFADFTLDKGKKIIGEKTNTEEQEEATINELPKSINKYAGTDNTEMVKVLTKIRRIFKLICTIPIVGGGIFSALYIFNAIFPSLLKLMKNILFAFFRV
jgi:hypothetical protein